MDFTYSQIRSTGIKIFIGFFIGYLLGTIADEALALRVAKPFTLSYPITEEQVSQINKYLEDLWNIQNGRFELDVTASKTNSKEGEIWINSSNNKLEWKSGGVVRSTP